MQKGQALGRYRIIEKIGEGGMGEVYLAADTKLDRQIALKILPKDFSEDRERMSRFVREAKAASALNHPNIITIYEIGEFDDTHYIATEYIKGEILNKFLQADSIKFNSVLDIAIQIASALDEAHTAGIIHRDIKPDNIMIRSNGLVKILDFGIAKLTEKQSPEIESEDKTAIQVNTTPGMIIGTANYMSPEQAKGKDVDTRTDIFSFGVVLYETISGGLPFEGETPMEAIAAIINKEPKSLKSADVPPEIERIITKALRKDRDDRYQTIKGLLADLKDVKKELEFQDKLEKTVQPNKDDDAKTQIFKATTVDEQKQTTNITGENKSKRWAFTVGGIGLLAVFIFAGWYFLVGNLFSSEIPFEKIKIEEITSATSIDYPVFSPDGKMLAFVKKESVSDSSEMKLRLILRQIGTGSENSIYDTISGYMRTMTFDGNGEFIYFTQDTEGKRPLFRVSTLGGHPQKIIDGKITNASLSPDGKKLAYKRNNTTVYISNTDGSNQEEIFKIKDIDARFFSLGGWSPDGTKLSLFVVHKDGANKGSKLNLRSMAAFDLTNQTGNRAERLETISDEITNVFGFPKWMPDGNGLIAAGRERESGRGQVFYFPYPKGKRRRITNDINNYSLANKISPDGKSIAIVNRIRPTSLWSFDPETKNVKQVGAENKSINGILLSSDVNGRLYFAKFLKDGTAIYTINEDGSDETLLFKYPSLISQFTVSPDGKYVFASIWSPDKISHPLYRINRDGSNAIELLEAESEIAIKDMIVTSGFVFFTRAKVFAGISRSSQIMRVSIEGGKAEKVFGLEDSGADSVPVISPDERYLAYKSSTAGGSSGEDKHFLRVFEFSGGKAGKKVMEKEIPETPRFRWTPKSDGIVYENENKNNDLFKINLSDGKETRFTEFNQKADTGDFLWSKDGKRVLFFRISQLENLVLIKDASKVEN